MDPAEAPLPDCRLYVPLWEGWTARIMQEGTRTYCFGKHPHEDYHHLILTGEIYLQGEATYCLQCALRLGLVTTDRLFWQHRPQLGSPNDLTLDSTSEI